MALKDIFRTKQVREEVVPAVDDVLLQALLGSEKITREKAMTLPAVAGAVDFISNAVACMPVKLYKEVDGKVEEVKDDSRVKCLNGDTGDALDAYQMKKALVDDYLMGKGGYCYIRRRRNEVTGLFYVRDIFVSFLEKAEPIINKDYQIFVDGKIYKPYEFIKLLRNTKDGRKGQGLTEEVSKALETAYQTLLYQLGMVKSGGNKRGFLKTDKKLGQDEIDVLKTAWRNMYGNNTESVVVLNNGLQFQEASNSSVEMQMNESKRTLRDEINDLFHIYPSDFERTFKEAIYPVIKAFETALNRDMLLEKEKSDHFFEFDVKEIIKASLNERYSAYKTAKETGFMTLNEIRRAENLNWIEGLDVINVGLGAVLYDTEEQKYFVPNTGEATDIESATQKKTQDMIEAHEEVQAFDESGNSAERDLNHGGKTQVILELDGTELKQYLSQSTKTQVALESGMVELKERLSRSEETQVTLESEVEKLKQYLNRDDKTQGTLELGADELKENLNYNAETQGTLESFPTVTQAGLEFSGSLIQEWLELGEVRGNPNHDPKTGRFTFGSGQSAWEKQLVSEYEAFLALSGNKKILFLARTGYLTTAQGQKARKDGTLDEKGREFFDLMVENGDYRPKGATRDNKDRTFSTGERTLIMNDTGFDEEKAGEVLMNLRMYTSKQYEKKQFDQAILDEYINASPTYNGRVWRGMHFDNPEDAEAFANLEAGQRIGMRGNVSSWTSDSRVADDFAFTKDPNKSSVVIHNAFNRTGSPIAEYASLDESEVIAPSTAQWTVISTKSKRVGDSLKVDVYVVEANTDEN